MPIPQNIPGLPISPLTGTLAQPTVPKRPVQPSAPQGAVSEPKESPDVNQTSPLAKATFDPQVTALVMPTEKKQPLAKASEEQVTKAVAEAAKDSYSKVPPRPYENRHTLNQRLQLEDPSRPHGPSNPVYYDGSDIVVISFEGTGAFEPRRIEIMQAAADNLRAEGLTSDALQGAATQKIEAYTGKSANWSGLNVGVHTAILKDPELQAHTQILSFPSEESELFKGKEVQDSKGASYVMDSIKDGQLPLGKVISEIKSSIKGETPGIDNALIALRDIQAQAKAQGKNPRFVIVGHSSGGRSMVKFLEKAKSVHGADGQPVKFDLAISIDPVREAHEAALEGVKELINKGTEYNRNRVVKGLNYINPFGNPIPEKKVYPATVGYQSQPESLYAPNNVLPGKYLSFYQREDTEGLGMGFGIHGSRVKGAKNTQIFHNQYGNLLGKQGHGEITYSPTVINATTDGMKGLLHLQNQK